MAYRYMTVFLTLIVVLGATSLSVWTLTMPRRRIERRDGPTILLALSLLVVRIMFRPKANSRIKAEACRWSFLFTNFVSYITRPQP